VSSRMNGEVISQDERNKEPFGLIDSRLHAQTQVRCISNRGPQGAAVAEGSIHPVK
jgi:hypothetical protein